MEGKSLIHNSGLSGFRWSSGDFVEDLFFMTEFEITIHS